MQVRGTSLRIFHPRRIGISKSAFLFHYSNIIFPLARKSPKLSRITPPLLKPNSNISSRLQDQLQNGTFYVQYNNHVTLSPTGIQIKPTASKSHPSQLPGQPRISQPSPTLTLRPYPCQSTLPTAYRSSSDAHLTLAHAAVHPTAPLDAFGIKLARFEDTHELIDVIICCEPISSRAGAHVLEALVDGAGLAQPFAEVGGLGE